MSYLQLLLEKANYSHFKLFVICKYVKNVSMLNISIFQLFCKKLLCFLHLLKSYDFRVTTFSHGADDMLSIELSKKGQITQLCMVQFSRLLAYHIPGCKCVCIPSFNELK